ncbi:unnamed protein product, partial [Closterium sp. Naga37s-1]
KFLRVRREWREGDVISLNISFTLRAERIQDDRPSPVRLILTTIPDDRPQYASLHSILFGPHLLVGLTDGDRQLIPGFDPSHPATWIRPVDPEVLNRQLISLSLFAPPHQPPHQLPRQQRRDGNESASSSDENAETYVVWRRSNEMQPMAGGTRGNPLVAGLTGGRPGEGTEEAMSATFRVRRPVERKGGDNGLIMKGRGEEEEAGNGEQGERWEQGEKEDEEWRWDSGGVAALIGREISLEPLEIPGSFLAVDWCGGGSGGRTEGEGEGEGEVEVEVEVGEGAAAAAAAAASGSGGETRRVVWQTRSEMDACRTDMLQGGKAETTGVIGACQDGRASVFRDWKGARGASREFLLLPISELRDERYTSYFNVTAAPPPAPPSPPPSPPSPPSAAPAPSY